MRIQHLFTKLVALGFLMIIQSTYAQDLGVQLDNTMIAVPSGGSTTSGSLNFTTPCSDFYVKNGKVWVKLDLGEQYGFGGGTAGLLFDIAVNLDLTLVTSGGTNPTINFNIALNNQNPEGLIYLDLSQYSDNTNTTTGLSYQSEAVNSVTATINSAVDNNNAVDPTAFLKIGLYYELAYGLDMSNNTIGLTSAVPTPESKIVTFDWTDSCDAPSYEFQLLRLFNTDASLTADERTISTNVDWTKALSFQTYSSSTQLALTIGEGQGFYVWRVRPIGTYYDNDIGNDQNWGAWNASAYGTGTYTLNDPTGNVETFFFEDPDDNTNYQYSRVFTEGNKVSEQATYATTLNQVKQTQRYFPSKDYKVISQTVLDNSGRPTLTTLPVPVEGERINKYRNNFVTTNGNLYRAKHFDEVSTGGPPNPSTIDATGAFSYYSSLNLDKRIPNAEGYPYTRVVFSNDGTDRVVEQSGVGNAHMIGDQASGQGRTVRTLYGTPTEEELVALFGDEAPDPEQVAKVITIDPNNTKSVAYITKEGNTIATGLTFSEDQAVLDKIDTGAVVFGRTDKITNNTATQNGFKASKRITVLEDATEINISYKIGTPTLEGLCNNLELDMDYALNIKIFDVDSGLVVQEFEQTSIKEAITNPTDEEITIDFGAVSLDTGTYYIQKSLIPADDISAKLVSSSENSRRLIEPYFEWLVNVLDEIDCEQEMQYLYEDIFFYGKTVFDGAQNPALGLGQNNGLLQFPSGIEYQFLSKDSGDPDVPDEFLDFYNANEEEYLLYIDYIDTNGNFTTIDFSTITSLGDIKPIQVRFVTPCCQFDIPIVFTPPFKKPTPQALEAYVGNTTAVSQLNSATNYYDTALNPINPNPSFLTDSSGNFTYEQDINNNVTITNSDAYPLDFEGYAISMLHECRQDVINPETNQNYTLEEAQDDIYNAMRGWHLPGLLNQMVFHMVADDYGTAGCANRVDGSDPNTPPATTGGTANPDLGGYSTCDVGVVSSRLDGAQYSVDELARCWEPLVIELVNKLCVEQYEADFDQAKHNVADNVDDQETGDEDFVDDAVQSIRSWILRWISRGKIKRKLRRKNIGTAGTVEDEVKKLDGNLVKKFLDCTGYTFADILDPNTTRTSNYTEFTSDFEGTISDGEYNHERLLNNGIGGNWQYFSIDPNADLGTYETPPTDPTIEVTNILKDIFPNIEDPVYAFKYFAYADGTFPNLEVQSCYRDPNICINDNGTPSDTSDDFEEPCCGGTLANPIPCNFCGLGYITCPYTKESWSCNQRYTFYKLIENYEEDVEPEGVAVTCANYYEATDYVVNPDFGKEYEAVLDENDNIISDNQGDFQLSYLLNDLPNNNIAIPLDALSDFQYLSENLVLEHLDNTYSSLQGGTVELMDINGNLQTTGVSIIENDAYTMMQECNSNCEERRAEFRRELISAFLDRCYVIGECKIDPNDNIIPEEDIDLMVDQMVSQCQAQCTISTFTCVDEGCRTPTRSPYEYGGTQETSSDFNTSYIDYGVSGPVVSSTRNENLLTYDPVTGTINEGAAPIIDPNFSATGAGNLNKYSYSANPSIWDVRRSLTYAEYSRWIQAMEWDILLDIPSKCDANGNYNINLTYDSNGLPQESVYILDDDGNWVVQSFSIAPSPYVSQSNPTGPGDTFLERDQYIKTNTTPVTPNSSLVQDPVESPSIGIRVEINNN